MAISFGARGAAVESLQTSLTRAGFSTNGIDGIYGNDTENAIQRAYTSMGVPGRSGAASDELIGALAARVGSGGAVIGAVPPKRALQSDEISANWGIDLSGGKPPMSTTVKVAIGAGLLGALFLAFS